MIEHHKTLLLLTVLCASMVIKGMDPGAEKIINKTENKETYNDWDEFITDVQNMKNQKALEKKEPANTNNDETQLMAQFNALLNLGNKDTI